MSHNYIELLGYFGSVLVALSLSLKSLKRLRIVNLAGALVFVIYGLLISSFPVVVLNTYLCGANLYRLFKDDLSALPKVD